MKKFVIRLQKLMLALVMATGFAYAVTNVNVACCAWSYQPQLPKKLEQHKRLPHD